MAARNQNLGLARLLLLTTKFSRKGFTLIELLVAIVVGSLIIGTLLYLVVELLQVNRREEVLTQTQQDMRRAIDYITRDAREAVFVYSTPADVIGQLDIPPSLSTAQPILAFWRLDPVDTSVLGNCDTAFSGLKQGECNGLKLRQSAYTLVVYFYDENTGQDIWEGPSRIVRFELPKYTAAGLPTLTQRGGYSDPASRDNEFANWTRAATPTAGNVAVLTDYVDVFDNGVTPTCPTGYQMTAANSDSFYACVRTGEVFEIDPATGLPITDPVTGEPVVTDDRDNQSLRVYLRGNALGTGATGRAGGDILTTYGESGRTPTLESEILVRGVLQKRPDSDNNPTTP